MKKKESQSIEYKQSWRNDTLKSISAFANSKGGVVYIGIDDRGKPTKLLNPRKLLEDIPNTTRNKLGIIPSVELENLKNNEIIKITIKQNTVPISYEGKYYRRSGSTVQELQGKELAEFLLEKTGRTWDDITDKKIKISDIDTSTLEKFKQDSRDRLPSITKNKNIKTILQKLHLLDGKDFKRATILLFGKDPQSFFQQSFVKIGKFLSRTETQTTDIVQGNLFQQLENVLEILRTKYLISNIEYEDIHRRDILEYPYEALREAIINALIHRDYSITSQIQIKVYPDKLIIMNEGKLPQGISVSKLKTEHISKPRNQLLAMIFYYAGYFEGWGQGTLKIIEECTKKGLPEPDFIEQKGVMQIVFHKDRWNKKSLQKLGLNKRQIKVVLYVKEHGEIINQKYQEIFKVSERTATRDLTNLCDMMILQQIGTTGKGTKYVLVSDNKDAIKTP